MNAKYIFFLCFTMNYLVIQIVGNEPGENKRGLTAEKRSVGDNKGQQKIIPTPREMQIDRNNNLVILSLC